MNIMEVLAAHGLVGNSSPYYKILRRKAYMSHQVIQGGSGHAFLEMTDDGGAVYLSKFPTYSLIRLNNKLEIVYEIAAGPNSNTQSALCFNRVESAIYVLHKTTLTKRRLSDGGVIWSKTISTDETAVCANSTGVYILDKTYKQVTKLSLTDGSLIWYVALPGAASHIQVTDAGEVFATGQSTTYFYKINAAGTSVLSLAGGDRYKNNIFWIFPGFNYIMTEYILSIAYYTFDGYGPVDLKAESPDLGYYTNNDCYPGWVALGKTRLFVATVAGDVLVFKRSNFSLVDKVACNAELIAAQPNSDNFIAYNDTSRLFTLYKK